MARWRKVSHVFSPSKADGCWRLPEWMVSHAAVPIAEHLTGDVYRIYFSSRDVCNRSFTAFLVLDLNQPDKPLDICCEPALSPGDLGCFDDSGAMASWLVADTYPKRLYYIGWNLGVTVPFRNSVGVAEEVEPGVYRRMFQGPILDRTPTEPHFCASSAVCVDDGVWRMWYVACSEWNVVGGLPRHKYHIRYAESADGLLWHRDGRVAIDFAGEGEYAISRPSVLRDSDGWHMWYSHRGSKYRIGYAASEDGLSWTRCDRDVGIDVSVSGWDSDMIEYPYVFDHQGDRFMLYNGNDYGRTGFGLAVLTGG